MTDEASNLRGRCLHGDQAACAELVERHARMVGTMIWRATGDHAIVEDLVQETFLRVFRALPEFSGRSKLSTWICTIAHRVSIDHLRKVGRWKEEPFGSHAERGDVIAQAVQAPVSDSPEALIAQAETDRLVREELTALPERHRVAIEYAAIEGLDYDTIARVMDVPVGTVKTLVFRGKKLLKTRIELRLATPGGKASR